MKGSIQTLGFLLFSIFFFVICASSCAGEATVDRRGYTRQNFDARIVGELDGERVEGILSNRNADGGERACATFLYEKPLSMKGIKVSRFADGSTVAEIDGMSKDFEGNAPIADIFAPVIEMGDTTSLDKSPDGRITVRVCDENCDLEYIFAPKGSLPEAIRGIYRGRSIELVISQTEKSGDKK